MRAPSPFWVVKCPDCSTEQTVFSRPATVVSCSVCGATVATPTGGQAKLRGELVRSLGG